MYRTERRKLGKVWVEAEFGLRVIGSQAPYMSLTGVEFSHPTSRHDRYQLSCGQITELVSQAFPELVSLCPWHLCTDGIPLHYIANAKFWWDGYHCTRQRSNGETTNQIIAHFDSTIARGSLLSDVYLGFLISRPWPEVREVLEGRGSEMQRAYAHVVSSLPRLAKRTGAVSL